MPSRGSGVTRGNIESRHCDRENIAEIATVRRTAGCVSARIAQGDMQIGPAGILRVPRGAAGTGRRIRTDKRKCLAEITSIHRDGDNSFAPGTTAFLLNPREHRHGAATLGARIDFQKAPDKPGKIAAAAAANGNRPPGPRYGKRETSCD